MAGGPLELWNKWATQILVLLSFTLQVILLVFAGIRRREASAVLRFLLWLAYQMADSTAIYAIGHLSLSGTPPEHRLVAFWAPFLLLHLGGPDSITAYSLEDSKLWLRHLLTLVVQVLGAAYVLYKYLAGGDSYLKLAAMLMFGVGVIKYAERTWALKCGNLDCIRSSLKESPLAKHDHFHPPDQGPSMRGSGEEFHLRRAHSMFHVCRHAIVDSWVDKDPENQNMGMLRALKKERHHDGMWSLMEMELSLMYDILYTKAAVIHTWRGYFIRIASLLAVAASLLLFHFSGKDGQSRVDVAVTYTLLAGALLLEIVSLLGALVSTWTYAFLCATPWSWLRYKALCTGRWDRLRRFAKTITGVGSRSRRWSGQMGQHNMLLFSSRHQRTYKPLIGRLARMLGYKDWWIRYHYSGTIEISEYLRENLFKYVHGLSSKKGTSKGPSLNAQGVIRKNWGQQALQKEDEKLYKYLQSNRYLGVEFQEGIIIWHISTDVLLAKISGGELADADYDVARLVKAIRTLSNYLMFLLVEHPYMLPGLAQSMLYRRTRENLNKIWKDNNPDHPNRSMFNKLKELFRLHDDPNISGLTSRHELAILLYKQRPEYRNEVPRLMYANKVTEIMLEREKQKGSRAVLKLLHEVWMDFLVYAGNRCSRESHAKKLSNGGELTTILWLMTSYLHQEDFAVDDA